MSEKDERGALGETRFAGRLRRQFELLAEDALGTRRAFASGSAATPVGRRWLFTGAVIAVVTAAAIAVVLVGLPGLRGATGPSPATAYEQTRAALIRVRGVHSLTMTSRASLEYGKLLVTTRWVLNTRGDWSYESRYFTASGDLREGPHFKTYQASANVERFWSWGTTRAGLRSWRRGGPPCDLQAQPGMDAVTSMPLFAGDFRSGAIAALEGSHATPKDVTAIGRPAWAVTITSGYLSPTFSRMDLVIDKRTGIILVRTLYDPAGRVVSRDVATHLVVNPRLPAGAPRTAFPAAANFTPLPSTGNADWEATPTRPLMTVAAHGAVRLPLGVLAARGGGGKLFVATWLPAGFALRLSTYGDGIQLMYRAGLDYVLTQTYWGAHPPLPPPAASDEPLKLTNGYFAGSTAWFSTANSAQITGHGVTINIGGSVSHDELVRILDSLAPYEG